MNYAMFCPYCGKRIGMYEYHDVENCPAVPDVVPTPYNELKKPVKRKQTWDWQALAKSIVESQRNKK